MKNYQEEDVFQAISNTLSIMTSLILVIVTLLGFSIFLSFVNKHREMFQRLHNVWFCQLAVVSMLLDLIYLFAIIKFAFGEYAGLKPRLTFSIQLGLFVSVARYLLYTLISMATLLRRYRPDQYLKLSLMFNWRMSLVIKIMIIGLVQAGVNYLCDGQTLLECAKDSVPLAIIPILGFNLFIQVWIILDWIVGRRKNIKQWMVKQYQKMKLYRNAVIPVETASSEDDINDAEAKVTIAVVHLQNWNQINFTNQQIHEIVSSVTISISFFLLLFNLFIGMHFGIQNTFSIRVLSHLFINFLTSALWIYNSSELRDYSVKMTRQFLNRVRI